jgi:hypothetical protein
VRRGQVGGRSTEGTANELESRTAAPAGGRRRLPPASPPHHEGRSTWSREPRCRPSCFPRLAQKAHVSRPIIVLAQEYGLLLGKATERVSLGHSSPSVGGKRSASPPARPSWSWTAW